MIDQIRSKMEKHKDEKWADENEQKILEEKDPELNKFRRMSTFGAKQMHRDLKEYTPLAVEILKDVWDNYWGD